LQALVGFSAAGTVHYCPFCAYLAFKQKRGLVSHINRAHNNEDVFLCSSIRQKAVLLAIYEERLSKETADEFWSNQLPPPTCAATDDLLRTSASIMRSMLERSPSFASLGANLRSRRSSLCAQCLYEDPPKSEGKR